MSAAAPSTVPPSPVDPDDGAREPRTPLRRWLLAAALAVPLAAAGALGGLVFVVREVLDHRAARREGREPVLPLDGAPSWVLPTVLGASPIAALGFAALIIAVTGRLSDLDQGEAPFLFAALAGVWVSFMAAIGAMFVVLRRLKDDADPQPVEGIEDRWFQQAAARSFWDVLTGVGLCTFVLTVWRIEPDAGLVLLGILVVAMIDFSVRLMLLKRREERA
jgi:hypothetical protein